MHAVEPTALELTASHAPCLPHLRPRRCRMRPAPARRLAAAGVSGKATEVANLTMNGVELGPKSIDLKGAMVTGFAFDAEDLMTTAAPPMAMGPASGPGSGGPGMAPASGPGAEPAPAGFAEPLMMNPDGTFSTTPDMGPVSSSSVPACSPAVLSRFIMHKRRRWATDGFYPSLLRSLPRIVNASHTHTHRRAPSLSPSPHHLEGFVFTSELQLPCGPQVPYCERHMS